MNASELERFHIRLASDGTLIEVRRGMTIIQALRDAGIAIDSSCESGYCGTCLTRYLDGQPVHRDTVLSEAEQSHCLLPCVAWSASAVITLDL